MPRAATDLGIISGVRRPWHIRLAGYPHVVQEARELLGHSDHGALLGILATSSCDGHAPPAKSVSGPNGPRRCWALLTKSRRSMPSPALLTDSPLFHRLWYDAACARPPSTPTRSAVSSADWFGRSGSRRRRGLGAQLPRRDGPRPRRRWRHAAAAHGGRRLAVSDHAGPVHRTPGGGTGGGCHTV